ncbi:hypothetical protein [Chloroflexus sp. MS-G]|jgi:hypothetical protein|uniref:hypothetical protein n=1 Tax=Chloroflexus sp. MS-G TaxID=1521187 RepID=UPI0004DF08BB|nr:hypothetical protein [Chloroflexus sp. MS-G]MBO9349333.1 hypothetical protein [Chloroflexus sp.]
MSQSIISLETDPEIEGLWVAIETARAESYPLIGAAFRLYRPPSDPYTVLDAVARELDFQPLGKHWIEVPRRIALKIATHIIAHDLAYPDEIVPEVQATELARRVLALLDAKARFFTNGAVSGNFAVYDIHGNEVVGWRSLSEAPLDHGLFAFDERRVVVLWAEDAP